MDLSPVATGRNLHPVTANGVAGLGRFAGYYASSDQEKNLNRNDNHLESL